MSVVYKFITTNGLQTESHFIIIPSLPYYKLYISSIVHISWSFFLKFTCVPISIIVMDDNLNGSPMAWFQVNLSGKGQTSQPQNWLSKDMPCQQ